MIYKNSYFSKEFRQSYTEIKISNKRMTSYGVFLGLLAFSFHFTLQTVYESVLTQALPEIMLPSYFSVTYIYTVISFLFFIVYLLVNYKYLTFNEIVHNKWYSLVKMGYRPFNMIMSKIFAILFSMTIIYTVGFIITIILTVFLKYFFVYQYLPTLYIAGYIDIILLVFITMSASIFIKEEGNARYFVISIAILLFTLKLTSKYYWVVSNRILMQNIYNMFDFSKSFYIPIIIAVFLCSFVVCIFGAKYTSRYYRSKDEIIEGTVYHSIKTNKIMRRKANKNDSIYKILDFATNLVLVIFIILSLAFNGIILLVSIASPEREVSIRGLIPYVFQSITMKPTLDKNDLAFFKKIDSQLPLSKGDVVLFKETGKVYVEQITEIIGDNISVDISYYPPMSSVGELKKNVKRDKIYGLYQFRNRWLGALILFANTLFGRILFLLIPSFLIFFYKPIINAIKKLI